MSKNPFENGAQKLIPAVLVYLKHQDRILMLHRNVRPEDFHKGKWNGLGGKCEMNETPIETASRELKEEAGIEIPKEEFKVLGVLQFPNFKAHKKEDWLVYVLTSSVENPKVWTTGPEGTLEWIPKDGLLDLNLWEGDKEFLPFVLKEESFIGTFWYDDGKLRRSWMQSLENPHGR